MNNINERKGVWIMRKLVCIGDSLTYGFGACKDDAWPGIVGQRLGICSINKGQNGDFTSGMAARFDEDVIAFKPDTVMIMGGSNDILNGWPLYRTMGFIEEMTEASKAAKMQVWIGIPMNPDFEMLVLEGMPEQMVRRLKEKFTEYRELLLEFCKEASVGCVDFQKEYPRRMSMENVSQWFIYGVHPTAKGYHIMAEIFADTVCMNITILEEFK